MEENTQKPTPIEQGQMPKSHTSGPIKKNHKKLILVVAVFSTILLLLFSTIFIYRYYKSKQNKNYNNQGPELNSSQYPNNVPTSIPKQAQ